MWDGMTLLPGRECGGCTVCCVAPSIDKPEIQKVSGSACRHCTGSGCAIHAARPPVCEGFFCAWRTVDIFDEDWRPDKSGVLASVETEGIPQNFDFAIGISLMLVGNPLQILRQRWFQDFVETGVVSSIPLFLSLPGPRGYQAASIFLNTAQMRDAITRREIRRSLEAALKVLRGWQYIPAVITHTGHDVST